MKRADEARLRRNLEEGAAEIGAAEMRRKEHIERHKLLHQMLDELVADWIANTEKLPSKATVHELMEWAYQQTLDPTEEKN